MVVVYLASGEEICIQPCTDGDLVEELRGRVATALSLTPEDITLLCDGEKLEDTRTIGSLQQGSSGEVEAGDTTILAVTRNRGHDWSVYLEDWLVKEGHCYAALMADLYGEIYACASASSEVLSDDTWALVFKENHEEDILLADGVTTERMMVDERAGLKHAIETGRTPKGGLWLGGHKYVVLQRGTLDVEMESQKSHACTTLLASRSDAMSKQQVHIWSVGSQIIAAFYDLQQGHCSGNCKNNVFFFVQWMAEYLIA